MNMSRNINDVHLYSMPGMSDNHHLKFPLHLTNCERSDTKSHTEFSEYQVPSEVCTYICKDVQMNVYKILRIAG